MTTVALFHSVLGMRPAMHDAAARLGGAGHRVVPVDQYGGRVFDDYGEAAAFVDDQGGFPVLMDRALAGVADLADGFVAMGFSNGGGMAEHVALNRRVAGVVLLSGALPLEVLGAGAWPAGVPAQIHYAVGDPWRDDGAEESVAASVRAAGATVEVFEYAGRGHLFTDAGLPDEYDPEATEVLWERVTAFLQR